MTEPVEQPSKCRSCDALVTWARTSTGKIMPVEPARNGNIVLDKSNPPNATMVKPGEGDHQSHFSTCPQAQKWRKP